MNDKIIVTGGDGRFAQILKKKNRILNLKFFSKKKLNILSIRSIENIIKKHKPNSTTVKLTDHQKIRFIEDVQ